ncbi:hypothetical protein GC163_10865 [bacterium]|nr:hypothetical protein [bacterium]
MRAFCRPLSKILAGGCLWLLLSASDIAAQPPAAGPERFAAEIAKFEAADEKSPPQPGGNLFIGSSSIRMWDLPQSFPGVPCVNRGFGGSTWPDVLHYADRILAKHTPDVIVVYCGDNDMGRGRTAEQIAADYREFVTRVHKKLPETKIVWVPIKPSGKRWALREVAQQANALVLVSQKDQPLEASIDIWDAMLGADGLPRPELFKPDQLHMTMEGYALWDERLRPLLSTTAGRR